MRQARSGTEGLGGSGGVRFGAAGVVGCVQASSVEVCSGAVRQAWQDKVWSGKAGFGWARWCRLRHGRFGEARSGLSGQVEDRHGLARQAWIGPVLLGELGRGAVWQASHGGFWWGGARPVLAWQAWQCEAWIGGFGWVEAWQAS